MTRIVVGLAVILTVKINNSIFTSISRLVPLSTQNQSSHNINNRKVGKRTCQPFLLQMNDLILYRAKHLSKVVKKRTARSMDYVIDMLVIVITKKFKMT